MSNGIAVSKKLWRGAHRFALSILVCSCCNKVLCSEITAEDYLDGYAASFEAIETVQCNFKTFFSDVQAKDAETGPKGLKLYSAFSWSWDARTDREKMEGRWGFADRGRFRYGEHVFAFDGQELRTLNKHDRGGRIAPVGDMFLIWGSPMTLAGRNLIEHPPRNVIDVLLGNSTQLRKDEQQQSFLEVDVNQGAEAHILRIWIDPDRGFLPKRIEVSKKLSSAVMTRVENTFIKEVSDGVWLPMQGEITRYALLEPIFPPGLDQTDASKLSAEEIEEIKAKVIWPTKPLGYGTQTFIVEPASVVVNAPLSKDHFSLAFPTGTTIWNEFDQRASVEGSDEVVEAYGEPSGSGSMRSWLFVLNLAVIACLTYVYLRRQHRPT